MAPMLNIDFEDDPDADLEERRRLTRRALLVRAQVEIPGRPVLSGHAVDVSTGGLGLQCPVAVPVGEEIKVCFPLELFGETRIITLYGQVCYCIKQTEHHYRLGLQFVHMDDDTAAFIHTLCN